MATDDSGPTCSERLLPNSQYSILERPAIEAGGVSLQVEARTRK